MLEDIMESCSTFRCAIGVSMSLNQFLKGCPSLPTLEEKLALVNKVN